ncbi:uncharacterized protein LOC123544911 [Mercenaria mercenaria]|uniref:uncharacterized protein LOC123544911 n=1 Tax=Mercenaria mercenaria TaxID=6596 RepID=UPI00234E7300|nr:uncharacterized protein LOC123544911 [Mercenaria mercenaria]
MTTDMLKFLTKKLKSQSLSEGQIEYDPEDGDDEERDSGTESDENFDDDNPYGSDTSLNDLTNKNKENTTDDSSGDKSGTKTHEISEHNFDTVSCTSDYERQSLDFDRHSSEDELVTINKENVAEKRKWSQVHCSGCCDSSSDDEVKEFLLNPQPVLLSSTPPKGVQRVKVYTRFPSQRQVLARMAPITVTSVSPRKRHRHATSENVYETESGALTQRPCLDFEKMQQVQTLV